MRVCVLVYVVCACVGMGGGYMCGGWGCMCVHVHVVCACAHGVLHVCVCGVRDVYVCGVCARVVCAHVHVVCVCARTHVSYPGDRFRPEGAAHGA